MKKDYTAICSCNKFEHYSSKLGDIKTLAQMHVNENNGHEIYIDRNADSEIDDSFQSIKMVSQNLAAVTLGKLGGKAKSEKKAQSSRENGKKGGRPKKVLPINK